MERIFKRIKNKFQQLKKPTENTKEFFTLLLWILGVYIGINLLPLINNFLLQLPSGLFLVLLLNIGLFTVVAIKSYVLLLITKSQFNKNPTLTHIYAIHSINAVLFCVFIIIHTVCSTTHF